MKKPTTRAECAGIPRPCPFVSCRYNLYLDVSTKTGRIKYNFPGVEVCDMKESCALDVAERGGLPGYEVARIMGIKRSALNEYLQVILEKCRKFRFKRR